MDTGLHRRIAGAVLSATLLIGAVGCGSSSKGASSGGSKTTADKSASQVTSNGGNQDTNSTVAVDTRKAAIAEGIKSALDATDVSWDGSTIIVTLDGSSNDQTLITTNCAVIIQLLKAGQSAKLKLNDGTVACSTP